MTSSDQARSTLTALQRDLDERLRRIESDRSHKLQTPSGNWTERATERENDEVLDRLAEATRAELRGVRHALTRLEANLYGVCEQCGGTIAAGRLASVPYATRCASCAAEKVQA